jgi:hypothetical protein
MNKAALVEEKVHLKWKYALEEGGAGMLVTHNACIIPTVFPGG